MNNAPAKQHKESKHEIDQFEPGGVTNATILIIRHAEKPDFGNGLTVEGEQRARDYVSYFQNYVCDGKPLKITHLYAAANTEHSHRPRLTLEPLAKATKLKINARFYDAETGRLSHELQTKRRGEVVLIAWHHNEIPDLLRALNADPSLLLPGGHWPNQQYSWVIELRYDADAKLISSRRVEK